MPQKTHTTHSTFPLRWKFFLALVAASVAPLLLMMFTVRSLTGDIKQKLFEETRADLTQQVSQELVHLAQNYSGMMVRDGKAVKSIVETVGMTAERLLDLPVFDDTQPLFSEAFGEDAKSAEKLKDLRFHPLYLPRKEEGMHMQMHAQTREQYPVSFEHMAFHKPPTAFSEAKVTEQARQLLRLQPMLKRFKQTYGDYLFRVYVGLTSGLHATYPGHGALPQSYDPRSRMWFSNAVQKGGLAWTSPLVDATTGRLTLTASTPIFSDEGKLLGVVGVDVLLEKRLANNIIESNWSEETTLMLAFRDKLPESSKEGLRIVAESLPMKGKMGMWRMGNMHRWMQFDKDEEEKELMKAISGSESGTLAMPWKGVPSLWAWAPFDDGGYFIAVVPQDSVMHMPNKIHGYLTEASTAQTRIVVFSMLLIAGAAFVFAMLGSRAITRPLTHMISAATRISEGDFSARIQFRTGDERDAMIDAFNAMGPKLKKHMETIKALGVAQEIQTSLLPKGCPIIAGWDVAGGSQYCDETGGDYYDFFPVDSPNGRSLAVMVGDVSGHGISSALLMTTVRALLRGQAECSRLDAADRITRVNALLSQDVYGTGRFMTMFALEVSEKNDVIRWVRAGHDPALLYSPSRDSFEELLGGSLPLGVLSDTQYELESREAPEPGSVLFIGTDGIWEARRSGDNAMFGKERVLDIIRDNAHLPAEAIKDAVLTALKEWQQGETVQDDVTLVVVKKMQPVNSELTLVSHTNQVKKELTLHAREEIGQIAPLVESLLDNHGGSPKVAYNVTLALDELISNMFDHGFDGETVKTVSVCMTVDDGVFIARTKDNGKPFNCTKAPAPQLDVPVAERLKPVGGMGVHLVKQLMDDFSYEREDDANVITIRKRITEGGEEA